MLPSEGAPVCVLFTCLFDIRLLMFTTSHSSRKVWRLSQTRSDWLKFTQIFPALGKSLVIVYFTSLATGTTGFSRFVWFVVHVLLWLPVCMTCTTDFFGCRFAEVIALRVVFPPCLRILVLCTTGEIDFPGCCSTEVIALRVVYSLFCGMLVLVRLGKLVFPVAV